MGEENADLRKEDPSKKEYEIEGQGFLVFSIDDIVQRIELFGIFKLLSLYEKTAEDEGRRSDYKEKGDHRKKRSHHFSSS